MAWFDLGDVLMKVILCVILGLLVTLSQARGQNFGNIPPGTVLGNPTSSAAPARPVAIPLIAGAVAFGADPTGARDSTAAINTCLAAQGPMSTCFLTGRMLNNSGNITIPANTTLSCGDSFADTVTGSTWNTHPALLLSSGVTITSGGPGATIKNCLILLSGMTFPAPNASAFAGLAISDAGNGSLTVEDTIVVGFDSCIRITGIRPEIHRLWCDAQGAVHPAVDIENGNTDSGHITELKIQPFATGNYGEVSTDCSVVTRTGNGMLMGGINYYDKITSQNYRGYQVRIDAGLQGLVWTDFPSPCNATYPNSTGLILNNATTQADKFIINGTGIGLVDRGLGSTGGNVSINQVFLNLIGGDCIQIGDNGLNAGVLFIRNLQTNIANVGTSTRNCGNHGNSPGGTGYAINYLDTSKQSSFEVNSGFVQNVASTPYFNIPSGVDAIRVRIGDNVINDLPNPSTLYGTTTLTSCTGIGSGTCALASNITSNPWIGQVILNAAGSTTATGSFTLTFPLLAAFSSCTGSLHQGDVNWAIGSSWQQAFGSGPPGFMVVSWANAGVALGAGHSYRFDFSCTPIN
jgi:hypothetical protein